MTAIEITVGGVTVKVEPAKPRTTTVFNVGVSSPQGVIQQIEEAQRREEQRDLLAPTEDIVCVLEALQVSNDAADAVMAGTACKWSDDEVKLAEQWVEQYNDALVAALTAELGPLWGDSYLQGVALRAARVGAQLGQGGAR